MGTAFIACGKPIEIGTKVVTWRDEGGYNAYLRKRFFDDGTLPWAPSKGCNSEGRCGARGRFNETWADGGEWKEGRITEEKLKTKVRQFVIHHDGCPNSAVCFKVLHDQRGLSVHFMLDNDGTIYQSADVADRTRHAGIVNDISVGIEIANRATARGKMRNYYPAHAGRPIREGTINGGRFIAWGYTDVQYAALAALVAGLTSYFPQMPLVIPRFSDGTIIPQILDRESGFQWQGLIAHWHLSYKKWDPGPAFEWDRIMKVVRAKSGAFNFPVDMGDGIGRENEFGPLDADKMTALARTLYDYIDSAESGYFPMGVGRTWHGGVHIPVSDERTAVHSIGAGTIVAVRMTADTSLGSPSFILVKHEEEIDKKKVVFFVLYMHLERMDPEEMEEEDLPTWLAALIPAEAEDVDDDGAFAEDGFDDEFDMETEFAGSAEAHSMDGTGKSDVLDRLRSGDVVRLNKPVKPGARIGYIGKYGPDEDYLLHFEIFSEDLLMDLGRHPQWKGPFEDLNLDLIVDAEMIADKIDAGGAVATALDIPANDGRISAAEMRRFWSASDERAKDELRSFVTRHVSEWHKDVDVLGTLRGAETFRWAGETAADDFVAEAKAFAWWDDLLAVDLGIPEDGVVYHYHPIRFIEWFFDRESERFAKEAAGDAVGGLIIDCDDLPEDLQEELGCGGAEESGEVANSADNTGIRASGGKVELTADEARCGESELDILRREAELEARELEF